ncbi:MAG: methyltransferase domain-containing protein [Bryobacteraceae bacterium]
MKAYPKSFYSGLHRGSKQSAEIVVPIVMDLLKPRSVVDVGCGTGAWLSVFENNGVLNTLGIDGSDADTELLQIDRRKFLLHDLTLPLELERSFDLVVCLEVAEHLPPSGAEEFVNSLTRLGPTVLFSAAIPYQGGKHHLNEQWPEYWAGLFEKRNYRVADCLRPRIWGCPDVDWWYAQNLLLFVRRDVAGDFSCRDSEGLSMIHPALYLKHCDPDHMTLAGLGRWLRVMTLGLPRILANELRWRLR